MHFLLDTNAVSDLVREHPTMLTRLSSLSATDTVSVCTIVRGELLFGLERLPHGKKREALRQKVHAVLASLPCLPVPEPVADEYARLKATALSAGLSLDENDLWIAATGINLTATVVTRDVDFSRWSISLLWIGQSRRGADTG